MPRRLDAEEKKLWSRVTATVRPLRKSSPDLVADTGNADMAAALSPKKISAAAVPAGRLNAVANGNTHAAVKAVTADKAMPNTLDGGWDRRLSSGRVVPDVTVDLHGHTLTSAHSRLERELARAISEERRVMLVVTGKPPRADQDPARPRGLIRQQLPGWLSVSPYRHAIAAVRNAHPRHGGKGALYLILRRRREERES